MHHVVAKGQPATEYLPGYLGLCGDIWGNCHNPQVTIISPNGCILRFLFHARISTACRGLNRIRALFFFRNYHRHFTSLPCLLNNVHRSLTSLLLRVILAHTLVKITDDAGAFILFSLVSATQRRRQLSPATGAPRSI